MKGNMSREEFKVWAEQAAAERDDAIQKLEAAPEETARVKIISHLKEKLNDQ